MEAASLFGVDVDLGGPALKAMSLRIPLTDYATLSAMATEAKISRNAMGIKVMQAGMAAILDLLPKEKIADIGELQAEHLDQLIEEHGED